MLILILAAALQPSTPTPPGPVACPGGFTALSADDCPRFIFFDSAEAEIRREWQEVLDAVATRARAPGTEVRVVGHSDRSGPSAANLRVSRERARVVRDELVARGIPADRIAVQAEGEERPLIATADGVREPQNRRVEIHVLRP